MAGWINKYGMPVSLMLVVVALMVWMVSHGRLHDAYVERCWELRDCQGELVDRTAEMSLKLDAWKGYARALEASIEEWEGLVDELQAKLIEAEYGRSWSIELVPSGVD